MVYLKIIYIFAAKIKIVLSELWYLFLFYFLKFRISTHCEINEEKIFDNLSNFNLIDKSAQGDTHQKSSNKKL